MNAIYPPIHNGCIDVEHLTCDAELKRYHEAAETMLGHTMDLIEKTGAFGQDVCGALAAIHLRIATVAAMVPADQSGAPFNETAFRAFASRYIDQIAAAAREGGRVHGRVN